MKYLSMLFLLSGIAQASLPEITQSIPINIDYALCNSPESVTIPWTKPAPEYDSVRTHWRTGTSLRLDGKNEGSKTSYYLFKMETLGVQALFQIQDGLRWTSTSELYDAFLILPLAKGETNVASKNPRWDYDSTIDASNFHFQVNQIKISCYSQEIATEQAYPGTAHWNIGKITGVLELTWKDLH